MNPIRWLVLALGLGATANASKGGGTQHLGPVGPALGPDPQGTALVPPAFPDQPQAMPHGRVLTEVPCNEPMVLAVDLSGSVADERNLLIDGALAIALDAMPPKLCVIGFASVAENLGCIENPTREQIIDLFNRARAKDLGRTTRQDRGMAKVNEAVASLGLAAREKIVLGVVGDGNESSGSKLLSGNPNDPGSYASVQAACAAYDCQKYYFVVKSSTDGSNLNTGYAFTSDPSNVYFFPNPSGFAGSAGLVVKCDTQAPTIDPVGPAQTSAPVISPPPPVTTTTPTTSPTRPVPPPDYTPLAALAALGALALLPRYGTKKAPVMVEVPNPAYAEYVAQQQARTVSKSAEEKEFPAVGKEQRWTAQGTDINELPSKTGHNESGAYDNSFRRKHGTSLWTGAPTLPDVKDPQAPSQDAGGFKRRFPAEEKAEEPPPPPPETISVVQVEVTREFKAGLLSVPIALLSPLFYGLAPKVDTTNLDPESQRTSGQAETAPNPPTGIMARVRSYVRKTVVLDEAGRDTYADFIVAPAAKLNNKLPVIAQKPLQKLGKGIEYLGFGTINLLSYVIVDLPVKLIFGKENAGYSGERKRTMTLKDKQEFLKNPNLTAEQRQVLESIPNASLQSGKTWSLKDLVISLVARLKKQKDKPAQTATGPSEPKALVRRGAAAQLPKPPARPVAQNAAQMAQKLRDETIGDNGTAPNPILFQELRPQSKVQELRPQSKEEPTGNPATPNNNTTKHTST